MGSLGPGSEVLVLYDVAGADLWHCRLLLAHAGASQWCILTPDLDIYIEDLNPLTNGDITSVRPRPGPGIVPFGIRPAQVYAFRELPQGAELEQLFQEGRAVAALHMGLPPPAVGGGAAMPAAGAAPAAAAPVAPVAAAEPPLGAARAEGGVAALERALGLAPPAAAPPADGGGVLVRGGDAAAAAPGAQLARAALGGGEAAAPAAAAAPDGHADARCLPVMYDRAGLRARDFRDAVAAMEPAEWPSWPIRGPRTVQWVLQHMGENGGTPLAWHSRWLSLSRVAAHEAVATQHEGLCRILQLSTTFDQLDICNISAMELVCRQLQLLEAKEYEKHLGKQNEEVTSALVDNRLYMGVGTSRGGLCICPKLEEFLSKELASEAAVMKEQRKAREERVLARPKKGDKSA